MNNFYRIIIERESREVNNHWFNSSNRIKNVTSSGYETTPLMTSKEYFFRTYVSAKSFFDEQVKYDGPYRRTSLESLQFEPETIEIKTDIKPLEIKKEESTIIDNNDRKRKIDVIYNKCV